jgi:hypothetical protein
MRNILLLCATALALTACDGHPGPEVAKNPSAQDFQWTTMKSPNTGRCYEVAIRSETSGYSGFGYMGMSELPCTELK